MAGNSRLDAHLERPLVFEVAPTLMLDCLGLTCEILLRDLEKNELVGCTSVSKPSS